MRKDLIQQYHFLIADLMEIDNNIKWDRILKKYVKKLVK